MATVRMISRIWHGATPAAKSDEYPEDSGSGCSGWPSVRQPIRWWWRSPINWRVSHGPCCPAAETIDISPCCSRRRLDGRGKDAALGKHKTLSTFPPPRRRKLDRVLPRSAEERRRRKNSPTACRKTWWRKCVPSDRGIYKDQHARIIIECPEKRFST